MSKSGDCQGVNFLRNRNFTISVLTSSLFLFLAQSSHGDRTESVRIDVKKLL